MNHKSKSIASRGDLIVILPLLLLSLVPVIAGCVRLVGLAAGEPITAENSRFHADPLPVALHILAVTMYSVLGAFQFAPDFRARHRRFHRIAGRVLVPAGLVAALTGLWMTAFYPAAREDGPFLEWIRYAVGAAMTLGLVLGLVAILRKDFVAHQAWMTRAYALGMGAGTQVLTNVPYFLLVGTPTGALRDGLMLAGWLINSAIAEWIIRRGSRRAAGAEALKNPAPA